MSSCSSSQPATSADAISRKLRFDRDYKRAKVLQHAISNRLYPMYETDAVAAKAGDDAADDPAVWYNAVNPAQSRVLGTNKKSGLLVYDLQGKQVQYLPAGLVNNVDVRDGFMYQGVAYALVAGSNRSDNSVSFFLLNHESGLLSNQVYKITSSVDEVYGICMYYSPQKQQFAVFVNGKGGMIEGYLVSGGDSISHRLISTYNFGQQPEGMVADDEKARLYVGVETKGIFRFDISAETWPAPYFIPMSDTTNPAIEYDVEGLALFRAGNQTYLLASSQGNFTYALFNVEAEGTYAGSFQIADKGTVDGVEETDGLEVSAHPFNADFPEGLIVVQDGYNFDGPVYTSQNFKYLSLKDLMELFKLGR